MKKEYIKPFAKVKVVETILMDAASLVINTSDPDVLNSDGQAKEFEDLLDFFFGE
jgi:hypothetical protein